MGVDERITKQAHRLTAAERRVAAVMADEPDAVAFGTVALVAQRAATSGPTVVRLAVKLGYAGFVELQADVQRELSLLLGPARDRIRQQPPVDLLARVAAVEEHNVRRTLSSVPTEQFEAVVDRLADPARAVWVLPGDVTEPVGSTLAIRLAQLRARVTLLGGSGVAAARSLAGLEAGDTLVAIDIRRYESWLVELTRWATDAGAVLIALTDGPLSPLAARATETLTIAAEGVGPFDSMAAGVALANALVAGVATRVRQSATDRLDRVEAAWTATGSLDFDPTGSVGRRPPGPASRLDGEPDADAALRDEEDAEPGRAARPEPRPTDDPERAAAPAAPGPTPSGRARRSPQRSAGKATNGHGSERDGVDGSQLTRVTSLRCGQAVEQLVEPVDSRAPEPEPRRHRGSDRVGG